MRHTGVEGVEMECMVVGAVEAARLLKISDGAMLKKLERGDIPAIREGKEWKIPVKLLENTIENQAIIEARERRKFYEENKDKGR